MSFSIRIAESMDWQDVRDLLSEAGLPTSDLAEDRMADFLVAESPQGDVLGAIGIERHGESALLRSLVISADVRHGGIGRALIERLEASAISAGIRELWLLTIDAEDFFGRLGYERRSRNDVPTLIQQTEEFSSLCPDTSVLMSRIIVPVR